MKLTFTCDGTDVADLHSKIQRRAAAFAGDDYLWTISDVDAVEVFTPQRLQAKATVVYTFSPSGARE